MQSACSICFLTVLFVRKSEMLQETNLGGVFDEADFGGCDRVRWARKPLAQDGNVRIVSRIGRLRGIWGWRYNSLSLVSYGLTQGLKEVEGEQGKYSHDEAASVHYHAPKAFIHGMLGRSRRLIHRHWPSDGKKSFWDMCSNNGIGRGTGTMSQFSRAAWRPPIVQLLRSRPFHQ
jgi:hypothetical protein